MGLLRRKDGFDRSRVLEAAALATSRRQRRRAIRLYRWVLAMEPRNADLHGKLAPLLAETGQHFEAWTCYRAIAKACLRNGLVDKALSVYREAALYLPREVGAWQALASLLRRRGQEREAVEVLIAGSRHLSRRWERPQAILLLRRVRELDPWNHRAVLELAALLAGSEQKEEARILLDGLAAGSQGIRLREVRAAQFRLEPGPRTLWRWLRSGQDREEPSARPATPRQGSQVVPLRPTQARGLR